MPATGGSFQLSHLPNAALVAAKVTVAASTPAVVSNAMDSGSATSAVTVTDTGNGTVTVNFPAFNAVPVVAVTIVQADGDHTAICTSVTTSTAVVVTKTAGATADNLSFHIMVFGLRDI